MKKRFLSLLLCLVLVLGLLPTVAFAAEDDPAVKAIQLGTDGIAKYNTVYFGSYETTNVPWYALNTDGFMLSRYTIGTSQFRNDCGLYNYSIKEEKVSSSLLKDAMDGLYAGETTLFTAQEQAAIRETPLSSSSMRPSEEYSYVPDVNAHLFPLSYMEVSNLDGNAILRAKSITAPKNGTTWWLRNVFESRGAAAIVVDEEGYIFGRPDVGDINRNYGIRPAFNLDLNSVLFTSAAEGGKAASGMDSGGLTAVSEHTGTEWKLTLLDSSRTFNAATTAYDDTEKIVTVAYSGAVTGTNEYISALVKDSTGEVTYYGRLQNVSADTDASGIVEIDISGKLNDGDTLYIFNEQYNGDHKTDYASAFQDVTLTVTKKTPTLTLSENSGTVYSNAGTTSFTYSYDGDGTVSATSSDTSVATVSVNPESKTVTATILQAGTATITVSADEGANYIDAAAQPYELTVKQYVAPSYNDSDPTYAITVNKAEHGTVTASRRYAERGERVTLTVEPDKGWTLETLTVADRNGKKIDLAIVTVGEKYTFQMPSSKVTVEATFMEDNTMLNYFVDVSASDYYYDAVLWAAVNGITSGVDALHFAPDAPCTRGQIVTFLWRAAGSPEPQTMSGFADVAADSYCAKAVAWAVERGITSGTGNGRFSPDEACTRAQAVTFLYRAAGSPAVSGYAEFDDVMTDAYYARAVAWATEQGVTEGVGSRRFAPDDTCTRGQIVTFLWRSQAD